MYINNINLVQLLLYYHQFRIIFYWINISIKPFSYSFACTLNQVSWKVCKRTFSPSHSLRSLVQISMARSMLVTNLVVIKVQNAKEDRQVCNLLFLFCSSTNWEIVVAHMPIMFPLAKFFRDIKLDANQISKSRNTKLPENVSYRLCLKQARSRTE